MNLKLKTISTIVAACVLSAPAFAQSYKFRAYTPGMNPNAGVLTQNPTTPTNPTNPGTPAEPEVKVSSVVFTSVTPVALGVVQKGAPNGAVVDITARDGDVAINSITISGAYSPPFVIGSTTCGQVLAKDQTCSATVSFESEQASGYHEGRVSVSYFDSKSDLKVVNADVNATMVFGRIAYSAASQIFPATDVGQVSGIYTTRLTNSGTGTLTVNEITAPAGFTLASVSCDTTSGAQSSFPVTLRSQNVSTDGCTLGVRFTPTASINYSGALAIVSDHHGGASLFNLSGVGQTPIEYATLVNTLWQSGTLQMSNGNLTGTYVSSTVNQALYRANKQRSTGKYYVEFTTTIASGFSVGLLRNPANLARGLNYFGTDFGWWDGHAAFTHVGPRTRGLNTAGAVVPNWNSTETEPFTVGMKVDLDTGLVVLVGSDCQDKSTLTLGSLGAANFAPAIVSSRVVGGSYSANFGQFPTNCPVPAGFNKGWF